MAQAEPGAEQVWFVTLLLALPVPDVTVVVVHVGQRCFSPYVTVRMWPFSILTISTGTDLHEGQSIFDAFAGWAAAGTTGWTDCINSCAPLIWSPACAFRIRVAVMMDAMLDPTSVLTSFVFIFHFLECDWL